MENQHLTYFKVENFKRFSSLELNDIGQFNIIVGDNNTGKTSLLEALLVGENPLDIADNLWSALHFRNTSFNDTPTLFEIFSKNGKDIGWRWSMIELTEWEEELLKQKKTNSEDVSVKPNTMKAFLRSIPPPRGEYNAVYSDSIKNRKPIEVDIPFVPFGNVFNHNLLKYYTTNIQNFPKRKAVFIKNLKNIIEDVIDVTVDTNYDIPALKVGLEHNEMAVLLSQFGDGAIKLFRLLVDVQVYSGKHLMIDEVEAGVHWSRYKAFWKTLLLASLNSNTQLFMTTHNAECLKYLIQAVDETPELAAVKEKFRLHELWEQAGDREVKADTFDYAHFKRFIENENEVRGGSLVWH